MPNIYSLINDIEKKLKERGWFDEHLAGSFSAAISSRVQSQFAEKERSPTLRLSKMGERCPCELWHAIHRPDLEQPLPAGGVFKYTFGHVLEALVIEFAKAAGHEVTGEQDELSLDGIVGHRDCVIDGYIVDVKSAATQSFNRIKSGHFIDTFGYLDQLDGYTLASRNDPLVRNKEVAFDLFVDKQLGHMYLHEHHVSPERERRLRERIQRYKAIVQLPRPPLCECGTITEANGNVRLDLKASYSAYKYVCFPSLRTFLYSNGPVFMTKVVKRPWNKDGPIREVDKHGQFLQG